MMGIEIPVNKKLPVGLKMPARADAGAGRDGIMPRLPKPDAAEGATRRAAVTRARKNMKAAERERMILAEAIRFFAEHGFEGQTRELAKRVGIAHSALYRHFPSKEALIERVYEEVYVSRWDPNWRFLVTDRARPLEDRLIQFYLEYIERIFTYEWVRIFVFSGLRSFNITGRYLEIVRAELILPVCRELRRGAGQDEAAELAEREIEAVWGLHGQIFYIAIRKFVYGAPTPDAIGPVVRDHVQRFLRGWTAPPREPQIAAETVDLPTVDLASADANL